MVGGDITVWSTSPLTSDAIRAGTGPPCGVIVSPDGRRVLTTGADGSVTVVDVDTGRTVLSITDQQVGFDRQATVSRDWRHMAWVEKCAA